MRKGSLGTNNKTLEFLTIDAAEDAELQAHERVIAEFIARKSAAELSKHPHIGALLAESQRASDAIVGRSDAAIVDRQNAYRAITAELAAAINKADRP